jgi:hypothetical protein
MKKMRIELPRTLADFKIKHIAGLTMLGQTEENYQPTMLNKCKVMASIAGLTVEEVKQWDVEELNKWFNYCVDALNTYEQSKPPTHITVNGVKYNRIDVLKQTGGWLIDYEVRAEEFKTHPELFMAMIFIEDGKKYGEVPTGERAQLFYEHMPATVVFDVTGFFLLKYARFMRATALVLKIRMRWRRMINRVVQIFKW